MLDLPFFVTSMLLLPMAFISTPALAHPSDSELSDTDDSRRHPFEYRSLYSPPLKLRFSPVANDGSPIPEDPQLHINPKPLERQAVNPDLSVAATESGSPERHMDTHTPVNHPESPVERPVKVYVSTFAVVRNYILVELHSSRDPHPCQPGFVATYSVMYGITKPGMLALSKCLVYSGAVAWGSLTDGARMGDICITIKDQMPVGIPMESLDLRSKQKRRCWVRYVSASGTRISCSLSCQVRRGDIPVPPTTI